MSQIECALDAPGSVSSVLSTDSFNDLELKEEDKVILLIKAVHVIPAKE